MPYTPSIAQGRAEEWGINVTSATDLTMGAVSEAMTKLAAILATTEGGILSREIEIKAMMRDLLAIPGLDQAPVAEVTMTEDGQDVRLATLFNNGGLRLTRGRLPAGFIQRPHNHGAWNIFAVYSGAVHYRSYNRLDDRSKPYFADLGIAEDGVMYAGDVTVLPEPPNDIHVTIALAPENITLLIAPGEFAPRREQYVPELSTYYDVDAARAAR